MRTIVVRIDVADNVSDQSQKSSQQVVSISIMGLTLRLYQQECLDYAKRKNTIVHLPTGYGKTLIAAHLIQYYLNLDQEKKVAFLVPTRALVEQQSKYVKVHCCVMGSSPSIQHLIGEEQVGWRQSDWEESMKNHIFVGTAALFQQAFVTEGYLDIQRFSLFVFDECHNATGASPMASVMRDAVTPYYSRYNNRESLRILGLTASFNNGNSRNLDIKRRNLEGLMLSTIFCPDVPNRIKNYAFKFVHWQRTKNLEQCQRAIQTHVDAAVSHVAKIKNITKVVHRCIHVFEELGVTALFFYIDRVIVDQLITKSKILKKLQDNASTNYATSIEASIPFLRSELNVLKSKLKLDPVVQGASQQTKKVERLVELIEEIISVNNGVTRRGILFVEQVSLVSSLANLLNETFESKRIIFGAVAGSGYQTERDRQDQLDKFKSGKY